MIRLSFGLIGATALSLLIAAPTMARHVRIAEGEAPVSVVRPPIYYNHHRALPVQDALRLGFGQGREYYPSGWGGLYGDGRYPGNTISNWNYPTWW